MNAIKYCLCGIFLLVLSAVLELPRADLGICANWLPDLLLGSSIAFFAFCLGSIVADWFKIE